MLSGGLPIYCTFYASLMRSSSLAVRILANICSYDVRSSTGSNVNNIEKEAKMKILEVFLGHVKPALLALRTLVPIEDRWRIGCFQRFLAEKYILERKHQDTKYMDELIDSLCIS